MIVDFWIRVEEIERNVDEVLRFFQDKKWAFSFFSLQLTTSDDDEASSASSSEACFRLGILCKGKLPTSPEKRIFFLARIILSDANFISVPLLASSTFLSLYPSLRARLLWYFLSSTGNHRFTSFQLLLPEWDPHEISAWPKGYVPYALVKGFGSFQ